MRMLRDSAIYVGGELVSKLVPFLLLPYFSRKLGVEGFGQLSYFQTFLSLFATVLLFGQEESLLRYFYVYGKYSFGLVSRIGQLYVGILGAILSGIAYLYLPIMGGIVLTATFQSLFILQLSVLRCFGKAKQYAILQILSVLLASLLTVVLFELFDKYLVEKRILALLVSNAILVAVIGAVCYQKLYFSILRYRLAFWYIIGTGLPIFFNNFGLFIRSQLDRVVVHHYFGNEDLGLYAMGATIASVVALFIAALNKALLPHYYHHIKEGGFSYPNLRVWVVLSLLLVPLVALMIYLIPETVFSWVFGDEFFGVRYYILVFSIASVLFVPYSLLMNYLVYFGKHQIVSYTSIIITVAYVLLLVAFTFLGVKFLPMASIVAILVALPILWSGAKKIKDVQYA